MVTGSDIKKARQRAGLSQAELAKKLDVSQRTIGGWERDEVSPGSAEQRLVDLLQLDAADTSGGADLSQVDDLDLVAEIARRLARARQEEGSGNGKLPPEKITPETVERGEDLSTRDTKRRRDPESSP